MASDIDFDELDKAVNSLMGGVKEEDDTPKAKTLEVKDTLEPGEDPQYDKLGEVARGIGNETLEGEREKTVVEDFVPDADENVAVPKLPVEESSTDEKNDQAAPNNDDTTKETSAVRPPAARRPTNGSRFMDVVHPSLDMKSGAPAAATPPVRPVTAVSAPIAAPSESDKDSKSDNEPVVTPFLPDANAKVEKRPLGGVEPDPVPEESEEQPVGELTRYGSDGADDPQKLVTPDMLAPELTEEEQKLQSIESTAVDESLLDEAAMQQAESGDTGTIHNNEQRDHQDHKKHHDDKKETAAAIFDIEHYHKPLPAAPAKKMGPLKLTGIVLLVIILSAGVGAGAVYLLFSMGVYAP